MNHRRQQKRRMPNPTSKVLHPHLVTEDGTETNFDAYESDGSVFSALGAGDPRSPIPMKQHNSLGGSNGQQSGVVSGFIKENPLMSMLAAATLGIFVAHKALMANQSDYDSVYPEEIDITPRRRQVPHAQQPVQPILMLPPAPQTQMIAQPQVLAPPPVMPVQQAQIFEVKKPRKKRRKKSATVQLRDEKGHFTSETVLRPKKK